LTKHGEYLRNITGDIFLDTIKKAVGTMGGRIPEETIDQIVQQVDIVEVIGRYVPLKKKGRYYFGLCPFHSEKSPSFSVTPDRQIFHCFGCGLGGTVIRFLMEMEQLSFREAVGHLAESVGVEISTESSRQRSSDTNKQDFYRLMELASHWFHRAFLTSKQGVVAREYVHSKGFTEAAVDEFQIGYAPSTEEFLISFLKKKGFSLQQINRAGLKNWPHSRNGCLMLPVCDSQGRVIGFQGRRLAERSTFLTSYLQEQKGYYLYHFHRARAPIRKQRQAILFPDLLDVISAWQVGVQNGVTVLQKPLTQAHAKVLARNADTVIVCCDGQQTERMLKVLAGENCTVKMASLPERVSWQQWMANQGTAFYEQVVSKAKSIVSFRLEALKNRFSNDDADQQSYIQEAFTYIDALQSPIERDHYLHRLTQQTSLSFAEVQQKFRQFQSQKKPHERDKDKSTWNNGYREVDKHLVGKGSFVSIGYQSEQRLMASMLTDRSVAQWVREQIDNGFYSTSYQQLAAQLYAYYDKGYSADIKGFLAFLDDEALMKEVNRLIAKEWPQPSRQELKDCVRHIKNIPLQQAIEEKTKFVQQFEDAGEPMKAAQLLMEIKELREKINKR
jgi:DNA primase